MFLFILSSLSPRDRSIGTGSSSDCAIYFLYFIVCYLLQFVRLFYYLVCCWFCPVCRASLWCLLCKGEFYSHLACLAWKIFRIFRRIRSHLSRMRRSGIRSTPECEDPSEWFSFFYYSVYVVYYTFGGV